MAKKPDSDNSCVPQARLPKVLIAPLAIFIPFGTGIAKEGTTPRSVRFLLPSKSGKIFITPQPDDFPGRSARLGAFAQAQQDQREVRLQTRVLQPANPRRSTT